MSVDSQMKGLEGNAMPLDAVSGHVNWSVRGKGGNKTLIGRVQTVDFSNGLASTYECQLCCPRSFYDSRLVPGGMIGYPGYQEQFLAQERTRDCFGNIWPWDGPSATAFFNSDDWNVASISIDGLCTAIAPGSTTLRASWDSVSYFKDITGICFEEPAPTESMASCNVEPPCAFPVNFRQTGVTDEGDGVLRFSYAWDSSTGVMRLFDLANCRIGEIVTYPNGNPFTWPSPPYSIDSGTPNPSVNEGGATNGQADDRHIHKGFRTPYTFATFTATQTYRYKCPCKNGGAYVNLLGPIEIVRPVQLPPFGAWTYIIQKSGSHVSLTLP